MRSIHLRTVKHCEVGGAMPVQEPRSVFISPTDEERAYFNAIDKAFDAQEDHVISNGIPAHAVYLVYKLLSGAEKSVKIYTGKLATSIKNEVYAYGDETLIRAAIEFLNDPRAILTIIVADEVDVPHGKSIEAHPFIRRIRKADIRGTFKLLKQNPDFDNEFKEHLVIMDDKAARIELEPDKPTAFVNFGDPYLARAASSVFSRIEEHSTLLNSRAD